MQYESHGEATTIYLPLKKTLGFCYKIQGMDCEGFEEGYLVI